MDTIRDPAEVLGLLPNVISSAYEEIMLLFPSPKTFKGFESAGLSNLIKNHIQKNSNVRVKLLLKEEREREGGADVHDYEYSLYSHQQSPQEQQHYNAQVKDKSTSISSSNQLIGQENVEVKFANPDQIDAKTALVIVDGEKMMTIDLDDEMKNDYNSPQPNLTDSIRFATHTNSESAIMSHASIFERIWIKSEMKQRRQQQQR
jgi:hypothetical protein